MSEGGGTEGDPSRPAGPPAPPARPRFEFRTRPSTVALRKPAAIGVSAALWFAAAAATAAAALVIALDLGALEQALRAVLLRDFPEESAATRDRVVALATLVLLGGAGLVAAVEAASAAALGAGRGGARFTLVPIGALALAHLLVAAAVVPTPAAVLLSAGVGLAVAGTVAMLLPGTYRWFALKNS